MKWNFKGLTNTKQLALAGIILGLMTTIGVIFERYVQTNQLLGTVINISPAEMLIIIPLFILGVFPSLVIVVGYTLLIMLLKGFEEYAPEVGYTAMFAALITYLFTTVLGNFISRPFAKYGHMKRGIITMSFATVMTTIIMLGLNIVIFAPTYTMYFSKGWTTIFSIEDKGALLVGIVGWNPFSGGIIHGNLIKYGICSMLALAILKSKILWIYRSKFVRPTLNSKIN